jgi:predicted transcriptional regulator
MIDEELRNDILAEIKKLGMVETTYIARRFSITPKSAIYHLKWLVAQGKVKFVACGKWYFVE